MENISTTLVFIAHVPTPLNGDLATGQVGGMVAGAGDGRS
jgi:hypothetical protein